MSSSPPVVPGRARRRGAAALVVLLTALSSWTAPATAPAGATTTDEPAEEATARLVVNGLEAVVGPDESDLAPEIAGSVEDEATLGLPSSLGARVLVHNPGTTVLDGLRLVLTVHRRTTTRSELRRAMDPTTSSAGPVEVVALDQSLDALPPGGFAQLELDLPADALALIDPANDLTIHPVTLTVARAFRVLDQVRFPAVGVARPIQRPLETVAIAPLDGPVEQDANSAQELLPGGRLDRVLRAVEQAPTGTVTLAPAPHAAEHLALLVDQAVPGATDMAGRLAVAASERGAGIVSMPYALADVPALASSTSTEALATQAIVAGRRRLSRLGVTPDAVHLLVSTQTSASLDLAPADTLVTTWDATSGPDLEANPTADIPPALRTGRSAAGRGLTVLVGDPWATEHLATATGDNGWAVEAQRVVGETAMLFAQAPGTDGRVAAIVPPVGWEAPGRLPDELYARLAAAPWLRLDDPVQVALRGSVTALWTGTAPLSSPRSVLLGRVATAEDHLDGLASAVAATETAPEVVTREDDLLRAVSVWPTADPARRADRVLTDLEEATDAAIGTVTVPADSVVTLASERGVIPVTVQHPDGVPLNVLVEVATQGRLTFDDTSQPVVLEEGGTVTVPFEVTALARGSFPMSVTVRTPGREVVLTSAQLQVRATAVSRPALLVIGGVVVLLLLLGRLRRPREPQLEVVR